MLTLCDCFITHTGSIGLLKSSFAQTFDRFFAMSHLVSYLGTHIWLDDCLELGSLKSRLILLLLQLRSFVRVSYDAKWDVVGFANWLVKNAVEQVFNFLEVRLVSIVCHFESIIYKT